ncbi:MAG: DUF3071 domain-containing protein [Herbiconiux sp.]|uniref:septation protein SepH n=1 Tax=Herbiconiux sp. TaxID=1871186 RepID=UPI00120F44E5|nr:septation protein SepH [Herbiconiux sp.]TAJ46260.1 MAG: DUF3071 domain-containing protein [Herbiconiux sp.]
MQDLTVVGVENGALIVSSDGGERFRVAIDELLQSTIRKGLSSAQSGKKVSPREIQTHIRAGLSTFEVAELTGADVEYIERFEGPVVAERQFMVDSALRVPVQPTSPADPLGEEPTSTFGDALEERLEGLDARDIRWASWKDETGWIVKLTFTSREIDHDARWQFDPKRHVLTPLNNEATTLSRHGELTEGLIPRLRAVSTPEPGDSRFDSGAFERVLPAEPALLRATDDSGDTESDDTADTAEAPAILLSGTIGTARPKEQTKPYDGFAVKRAPDDADTADHNQTADLLEALRRRRGERESAAGFDADEAEHPIFGGPRAVADASVTDTPLDGLETELIVTAPVVSPGDQRETGAPPQSATPKTMPAAKQSGPKRQRAAMPSWDEIVFGARSEDDPA